MLYDYNELLEELYIEIHDGALSLDDTIQVLRETEDYIVLNKVSDERYFPIIDWYYSDEEMMDILKIDENDNEQDILEVNELKEKYEFDYKFLENIMVEECINEMKKHLG